MLIFPRKSGHKEVWVAKVIIPASSYESFKQSVVSKKDETGGYSNALADSTSWWKPTEVVLTKRYWADSYRLVNVIVSKEEKETAVYIECAVF